MVIAGDLVWVWASPICCFDPPAGYNFPRGSFSNPAPRRRSITEQHFQLAAPHWPVDSGCRVEGTASFWDPASAKCFRVQVALSDGF